MTKSGYKDFLPSASCILDYRHEIRVQVIYLNMPKAKKPAAKKKDDTKTEPTDEDLENEDSDFDMPF